MREHDAVFIEQAPDLIGEGGALIDLAFAHPVRLDQVSLGQGAWGHTPQMRPLREARAMDALLDDVVLFSVPPVADLPISLVTCAPRPAARCRTWLRLPVAGR